MTTTQPRYCVFRSLSSDWIFVQPEDDEPRPNTLRLKLGFVSTFSHNGAVSFAEQCGKLLGCKIAYINMEAKTS